MYGQPVNYVAPPQPALNPPVYVVSEPAVDRTLAPPPPPNPAYAYAAPNLNQYGQPFTGPPRGPYGISEPQNRPDQINNINSMNRKWWFRMAGDFAGAVVIVAFICIPYLIYYLAKRN